MNPFEYLARNAETNPSGVFIETVDQKVLNRDALVQVKKLAYELRRLGVSPGDLVALDLPDALRIMFIEAVYHEAAVGTVLPRGFVSDGSVEVDWMFSASTESSKRALRSVTIDSHFLEQVEQNPFGISPREFDSGDSTYYVMFSSGTTGRPKAIANRIDRMAALADNALETWMEGEPFLVLFDTATPMGFNALNLSIISDRPFLAVGGAGIAPIIELAVRHSVTSLKGSPAQMAGLVAELGKQHRTLPLVRSVYVSGTVMPPTLAVRLRAATEGCVIHILYGSTEATIAAARYYDSDDPFDVGTIFPGSTVQIVDEDDQQLPSGQVGRIRHRHPLMVQEYLGNPEATRIAFKDGWFYPGDLGLIREDGGLTLAGRSSEILNAGGVKIDPTVLDLFARSHPNVLDAASFTYLAATDIDQVGIALVSEDGLDVAALIEDFKKEFGEASPTLVARVQEIPRNAMGKPLRLELAEKYAGS